jgi:hypothetical protein
VVVAQVTTIQAAPEMVQQVHHSVVDQAVAEVAVPAPRHRGPQMEVLVEMDPVAVLQSAVVGLAIQMEQVEQL